MSSNVFVTPRAISTIGRGRIDHNSSLQALLQNFASNAQPVAASVNLEGTTGLQTGMLWYKSGNLPEQGDGRLLVYNGTAFTRSGIAVHNMSNLQSANSAVTSGFLGRGDLVDVGDNKLYMVNAGSTGVFEVGSSFLSNLKANTDNPTFTGTVFIPEYVEHVGDAGTSFGFPALDTFAISTNNLERIRVVSNGFVGIGTATPNSRLQVAGTVTANAFVGDGSGLTNLSGGGVFLSVSTISSNTNAVSGVLYALTNTLTLTLPASPAQGAFVGVTNLSNTISSTVARNGQNIMALAENLTVDVVNGSFTLYYSGNVNGWVIV